MTGSDYKQKLHIAVTIFIMSFIFLQSALPGDISGAESNVFVTMIHDLTGLEPDLLSMLVRKTAHFTEYMILGASLAVNVCDWVKRRIDDRTTKPSALFLWLPAWAIGTIYAVTDEVHQYFVPERACALADMMIDSAGVAAGAAVVIFTLHRDNHKTQK